MKRQQGIQMTTIVGIRDIARNINIIDKYDYVDVEDKKTHEYKGLFLSPKYAKVFKEYLEEKEKSEKQKKLSRLKKYAGKVSIERKYDDLSSKDLKKLTSQDKFSE